MILNDGVVLERTFSIAISAFLDPDRMGKHPVPRLEARDSAANLDDLASEIDAEYGRVLDPAIEKVAKILLEPVDGIYRHCVVSDNEFMSLWSGIRSVRDFETLEFGLEPCCRVGRHVPSPITDRQISYQR
jgi:hypothetical protein